MSRRFVFSLPLLVRALLGAAALAIAIASLAPPAHASCGSESCPLDRASLWDESLLSFELAQQYIDQKQPRVGTDDASVGAIPAHHDEVRTVNRITTARAAYRPGGAWTFSAALPFVNRTHEHIHNHMGVPEYQRWNYAHVGDLEAVVLRHFGGGADTKRSYFISAGFKAPTGVTEVEEVDGDQPEPSARPGTGSWDVLAGVGAEWSLGGSPFGGGGEVPLRAGISGRWNARGTENYQVGAELTAHLGTEVPVARAASLLLQTNLRVRVKDDVGDFNAEEGNTGGTAVYVSPGVKFTLGRRLSLYGLFQVPVYQRVNGIQIVSESNLYFGLSRAIL